jgi:predicted membrane-bound spermidine synthase
MRKSRLLLLIILIEGYVVLASELLAIRELIPFVGSGTEIVSIIISAVLLPLAFGYHIGGRTRTNMRARLIRNVLIALLIFSFGLSYFFLEFFFHALILIGIEHRILQTACYSFLFLALPIFLLGQTVPLVSNYFSKVRLSEITGKMLFFSTIGSFLGSVFSTLVLMNLVGVHITVIFTLFLLVLLIFILSPRLFCVQNLVALIAIVFVSLFNSNSLFKQVNIVSNNAYNLVAIDTFSKNGRELLINRSHSSALDANKKSPYPYVKYINNIFITPIQQAAVGNPKKILVIGAGGFTIGLADKFNHYTFVDIDPKLKNIAEKYLIQEPLSRNKKFVAESARAFLHRTLHHYDLIVVDTYTHIVSVPMETTTREFLLEVKQHLHKNGIVVVNQIMSPDFNNKFSVRYNNVFASVFPVYTRQVLGDFNPWATKENLSNVLYIYYNRPDINDKMVYTDDRNTYSLDYNN